MPDPCETCVALRTRLDEEVNKSFCFQADIRSALGNPDDGVPFDEAVKALVAENKRLRVACSAALECIRVGGGSWMLAELEPQLQGALEPQP